MTPSSSSAWVRGLLSLFTAEGADIDQVLCQAGIDRERVNDPNGRFATDEVSRLWESAVQATGNPALGLDVELAARHIDFEDVGYAMLSSADLRSGLEEFARYLALMSSATTCRLEPDRQGSWVVIGHTGMRQPLPAQRSAYSLIAVLAMCRWVTRQPILPLATHLGFPQPAAWRAYAHAFGGEVRFGGPDHRMLLSSSHLATRIPSGNASLLAMHEQALAGRLATLRSDRLAARVEDVIGELLPKGEPRRQAVALRLGMAERMLEHRLEQERTSFHRVLDGKRKTLAQAYLLDQRLALGQVSHALGFADDSSFFRACRRWFGMPPGQYRERHAALRP